MGSTSMEIEPRNRDAETEPVMPVHTKDLFPPLSQGEWDTMYYALALKGRGSPIQTPDSPLEYSIEYRMAGYSIGDVILFDIRGFVDFQFNICVPGDSPLNGLPRDIPGEFAPLFPPLDPANVHEDTPLKGHTVMEGKSVRKFQVPGYSPGKTFDAVAEEKAILTIPEGVTSQDVIDVSCFRKYVAANAIGWYKFVNEVGGRRATNGDLRIVVGWDHCKSWSRVVTSSVTVHVPDDNVANAGSSVHSQMGYTGSGTGVLYSLADDEPLQNGAVYQNQSTFLRTLNISVCDDIWCKIAEDYRPHIESFMGPQGTPYKWDSHSLGIHPANDINALLLKQKPSAKFAMTQDSDWISVLKPDDPSLPTANEFLSRILEVYNVCEEDDVVFLKYKPEVIYRTYLTHNHDVTLTLPLWSPTIVAVGAVGYFSREDQKFITLFNARAPSDSTSPGIPSLPRLRTKITQTIHNQRRLKSKALNLLSGLLNLDRKRPPQQISFPLKVGEKAAHIHTGVTRHRRFQADNLPMDWFKSNIDKIFEIYGVDHHITREDLVLITGTLDTQDYALFVSASHREGFVTFEVDVNPQVGQPWGAFSPTNNGQFTAKVSQHGGPWETVLASCVHVASLPDVPSR